MLNTYFYLAFLVSLSVSVLLLKVFIPILRKVKLGQKILEIGPSWHKCKEGTPTMGGLFFIIAIIAACSVFAFPSAIKDGDYRIFIHMAMALMFGFVGFIDDYVKLFKKRNQGLTASQKMAFQIGVSILYLWGLNYLGYIDTTVYIPFADVQVEAGLMYYIFAVFIIVYLVNCANLTDGIDGLAGSVATVIFVLLLVLAIGFEYYEMSVLCSACIGAVAGFLIFNFHPARVFMGDTGSQFLGGIIVAMSVWVNAGLVVFLIGLIYLIEGISVILQVVSYKLRKKRIFKMAPIHHHFEMCGWSEVKIVGVFSFITALCCAAAYFVLQSK